MTEEERERYSRQIMLAEIGLAGQQRLQEGRVLVVGAGGLGSPAALYLAAAGVGTVGIADGDTVEISNLQRQILHATADIGSAKVRSAREKLAAINPGIRVVEHGAAINADNFTAIIDQYDFIIDATDNFTAKFLINDTCVLRGKPFSHGGVLRFTGQTLTVKPFQSPCYRCIFPEPPPEDVALSCSRDGIIGALPGIIGCIQACEALKFLLGSGDLLTGRLLTCDALGMRFREVRIAPNPACPSCGRTAGMYPGDLR